MNIKILDCTLRDGGYYNNWDFEENVFNRYLSCMENSTIDVVELGFRFPSKSIFMGPFAYTTDDFLNTINLPENITYAVMINGKDFLGEPNNSKRLINQYFQIKDKSKISLVRIAINFDNVKKIKIITKIIKDLGYQVGVNMMQSHNKDEKKYIKTAIEIDKWNSVDVLYFADSLGNMSPNDVKKICKSIKMGWKGPLGIHTHNNKNLALINSLTAIKNDASWCDGTVTGMGRGAGNVSTESLILEMSRLGYHNGSAKRLQPTIEDFSKLKNKHNWGSNLYYHYAANHGIHPTFVQSLLDDRRYDNQQVLSALEFLADRDSTSYSTKAVRQAIYGNHEDVLGTWDASGWLKNKEALIVGAGPSVKKYNEGILSYIKRESPEVLFLNINRYLPNKIAKATIVSHETRALFDSQHYSNLNHPIILPEGRLAPLIKDKLYNIEILDYGLTLEKGSFVIEPNNCRIEWPLAAAYAIAIATQAGATKISLVGFDGFTADDPRQEEMNEVFNKYLSIDDSIPIVSLTPTTYNIERSSIYSPI